MTSYPGVWYDPSDLSTMFQDSAGTTPVTAVEQSVGLILDKSKGGWGSNITTNSDFSSGLAGWDAYGYTAAAGGAKANGVTVAPFIRQSLPLTAGKTYRVAFTVSGRTGGTCYLVLGGTQPAGTPNLVNGAYSFFIVTAATDNYLYFATPYGTFDGVIDNVTVREIPGNHASQSTTGYKPVLKQDANGCYYLKFDGLDDFLVTGNVDFSASDKIAVAAGVRKLSDATAGIIAETSSNALVNNGAFGIYGPHTGAAATYGGGVRGTVATTTNSAGFASPNTSVVSCLDAISADDFRLRANGVQIGASFTDQGAGNFGNYPLYIGRRGGTSLPFNGHLYGLFIGGGMTDLEQLKIVEKYLGNKTGIQL